MNAQIQQSPQKPNFKLTKILTFVTVFILRILRILRVENVCEIVICLKRKATISFRSLRNSTGLR